MLEIAVVSVGTQFSRQSVFETKVDQAAFLASDPVADSHPEAHEERFHLKSNCDTVVNGGKDIQH
ncbi:hypothetical protein PGT21_007054 [Puccinia graminis f. sp. tritici]|uniref:Uncharacterized protein n=1 Tax=Puccinia graminis f. sp. tritici TaxID=56615 RepID=A0A5B0MSF0_PUCGR|nr:hypothetical protein PGT21_007054 [Puccinia graminis f. sp. tritici]KAA1082253.1 hypothetical protein PGTUg99_029978 [Puccinia graminis f. sp. tritici]